MTGVTRSATAASEPAPRRRSEASCPATADVSAHLSREGAGIGEHSVLIADRQSDVQIDSERYRVLVCQVLEAEGVLTGSQAAVTFVGADEMARLNETHMGHDGPTDVLAFPLDLVSGAQSPGDRRAGPVMAGDVVVCPAVAASNASTGAGSRPGHDGSITAEIDLLVVHGVLHLLGMDHAEPDEAAAMRARESEHLHSLWSRP
ncbi:rRNA maturation RNase YbeY [Candidatus Poriferisodalis sp.]|uniref:rRNA maturation RNase YbeY n=1 Tax=Candidatus Poriferisodalis sp. TaxID=3101277 RepID=UPI003B530497